MARSPNSQIPFADGQLSVKKRNDKASECRSGGEANLRAATKVNADSASLTPPTSKPTQLDIFSGRACPLKAKPAMNRQTASNRSVHRDGVEGGGTQRKNIKVTGETLISPTKDSNTLPLFGRGAYKSEPRNRRPEAVQGVGGGHSTYEPRENRGEERAVTSTTRSKRGKTAGLRPRGYAQSRQKSVRQNTPERMDKVRKLQRTLYRVAKQQPGRSFTLLYDKVCRFDVLNEAWNRVRKNRGASGIDKVSIEEIEGYGAELFIKELQGDLMSGQYRASHVRRVHIPKVGQPDRTRPLGIPTVKDRVVQMAVKIVIEPLFEAEFLPCSFGFRPKRTQRMALSAIVSNMKSGFTHVVDVDLKSYFDTIDHELLIELIEKRVGDINILRLIRAWLKAGVMEEGKVTHPVRGSPQGGVISPLLSNIFLHEVDRQWCQPNGKSLGHARLVRYADDMLLMAGTKEEALKAWESFNKQINFLRLTINQEKSRLTTAHVGFTFLGFEIRYKNGLPYMWPRAKAQKHILQRVRQTVRSFKGNCSLREVIRKLNPILNGWCTYFRVGNSNRAFHKIDWLVRSELQLWLRRKHNCRWYTAKKRWNYQYLHKQCGLYIMVGKVSHLSELQRM